MEGTNFTDCDYRAVSNTPGRPVLQRGTVPFRRTVPLPLTNSILQEYKCIKLPDHHTLKVIQDTGFGTLVCLPPTPIPFLLKEGYTALAGLEASKQLEVRG